MQNTASHLNHQDPLRPEDDSFYHHKRSDSPWWNESSLFGFSLPEKKINGFLHLASA